MGRQGRGGPGGRPASCSGAGGDAGEDPGVGLLGGGQVIGLAVGGGLPGGFAAGVAGAQGVEGHGGGDLAGAQGHPGAGAGAAFVVGAEPGFGEQVFGEDGDPVAFADRFGGAAGQQPVGVDLDPAGDGVAADRPGRSMARRSSTPAVPSWVVKLRGSSPRRPVTVTVMGFTGFLLV